MSLEEVMSELEEKDSQELKDMYAEYNELDDLSKRQQMKMTAIHQLLKGRGERVLADGSVSKVKKVNKTSVNKSSKSKGHWKHKVVTEPVLSNQKKLQDKLNRLGKTGWKLVDTQRHSMAGKQHAVCFLRKKVNDEMKEINNKLGELLELQKENSEESVDDNSASN